MFVEPGLLIGVIGPDRGLDSAAALAAHEAGGTLVVDLLRLGNSATAGQEDEGGKQENRAHGPVMAKCMPVASRQNNVSFLDAFSAK